MENTTGVDTYTANLDHARSEFNKNRKFIVKNVPPVTYEEVKQFIGGFTVSNISISKKCRHAIVTLVHGDEAEEAVSLLSQHQLLGTDVQVSLCSNDNMLCVTHLPLSLSDEDFRKEVEPYGPLEKCFLMRSSQTGFSKGYGFVEYAHNRMKTTKACDKLNGHKIGSTTIRCSFLDSSVLRFEELHSRFLLVEELPPAYMNSQELKNICSVIIEPESFQLEKGQRLAVLQYKDVDDADATQREINGHVIDKNTIVVSFCRPGVAVLEDMCREAVSAKHHEEELSKVPPPPLMPLDGRVVHPSFDAKKLASPVVKRLLAQNPEALEKFIELLGMLQMQISQEQEKLQPGIMGAIPGVSTGPLMNPNLQIALLSVMMAQQIQRCQPSFIQEPSTQEFILNSLQCQQQQQQQQQQHPNFSKPKSSLLGSPLVAQANSLLMNVINNSDTQSLDNTNANPTQPPFTLFPGPEQESLSTSCLQDFSHLVTALTPKTAAMVSRRVTTTEVTEVTRETESNVCSTTQTRPESSTEAGLSRAKPTSCPNVQSMIESMDSTTQIPNPFFNLPGVGYANPFLASFIEQQIKSQVRQINQTAPKPVSLLDLPVMNRNANGLQNVPGNCGPPSMPNISNLGGQGKPGILGPPPAMHPQSILGNYPSTPTSWNKPPNLMGNYMAEKRTLSFEESKMPMKRKPTSQPQSLLGEPPASIARNYEHQTCYGDSLHRNVQAVNQSGKVTSLMDMDLTSTRQQNTAPNAGAQWAGHYGVQNLSSGRSGNHGMDQTRQNNQNFSMQTQTYSEQYFAQTSKRNVDAETSYTDRSTGQMSQYPANTAQPRSFQTENQVRSNVTNSMPNEVPVQPFTNQNRGSASNQLRIMNPREAVWPLIPGLGTTGSDRRPSSLINQGNYAAADQGFIQPDVVPSSGSSNIPSLLSATVPKGFSLLDDKPHLVPSPEASPDGVYVGQHSQGLGGHYAASYYQT